VGEERPELAAGAAADAVDEQIGAGAQALQIDDEIQVQRGLAGQRERREGTAIEDRQRQEILVAERAYRLALSDLEDGFQLLPFGFAALAELARHRALRDGRRAHSRPRRLRSR
jgi:hypothetical protein